MAGKSERTFMDKLGGWLKTSRPTFTWVYCSAILFPMAFALVAALFIAFRHRSGTGVGTGAGPGTGSGSWAQAFFPVFYLALIVTLASIPRSIMPILLIWLAVAHFKPTWDTRRPIRYAGLFLLMLAAVSIHSLVYGREFNLPWLGIGWLSLALPRMAFPALREGLGGPA
jgi:hypothetical protein